jgi:hypothetical protein
MKWLAVMPVMMLIGGILLLNGAGGGNTPDPVQTDVLSQAYANDRVTQIAVLKELAEHPFDGTTADGRKKAGEWFNSQRFRNRSNDFGAYSDEVAEAIASDSEVTLAKKLEGVK